MDMTRTPILISYIFLLITFCEFKQYAYAILTAKLQLQCIKTNVNTNFLLTCLREQFNSNIEDAVNLFNNLMLD